MLRNITVSELAIQEPLKPDYYVSDAEAERIARKLSSYGTQWSAWSFHDEKRQCQNRANDLRNKRKWPWMQFLSAHLDDGRYVVLVRASGIRPTIRWSTPRAKVVVDVQGLIRDGKLDIFLESVRKSAEKPSKITKIESKYLKSL
jgi:hypothetical protein